MSTNQYDMTTHLDSSGNLVHVLGFDDRLQIIFKQLCEVILQFGAPEVRQYLSPVRWFLKSQQTAFNAAVSK